tara:strand:- start:242 stop:472 length:231 start_codon:yes stop_codon:yes gene_type:complete
MSSDYLSQTKRNSSVCQKVKEVPLVFVSPLKDSARLLHKPQAFANIIEGVPVKPCLSPSKLSNSDRLKTVIKTTKE